MADAPLPSPDRPLQGSCLCGGVRYDVTAPFRRANLCHCSRCRKHFAGTPATWEVPCDDGLPRFDGPPQPRSG